MKSTITIENSIGASVVNTLLPKRNKYQGVDKGKAKETSYNIPHNIQQLALASTIDEMKDFVNYSKKLLNAKETSSTIVNLKRASLLRNQMTETFEYYQQTNRMPLFALFVISLGLDDGILALRADIDHEAFIPYLIKDIEIARDGSYPGESCFEFRVDDQIELGNTETYYQAHIRDGVTYWLATTVMFPIIRDDDDSYSLTIDKRTLSYSQMLQEVRTRDRTGNIICDDIGNELTLTELLKQIAGSKL